MTAADKTKLLQYLQCQHGTWLSTFSSKLGVGSCVNSLHQSNMEIHYLIKVIYNYLTNEDIEATITEVYNLVFTDVVVGTKTLTLIPYSGGPTIATYTGSGTLAEALADLVEDINTGGQYVAGEVTDGTTFTLYKATGEAFPSAPELSVATGATLVASLLSTTDYESVADDFNCITFDELDKIVCRLGVLLENCNC